MKEIGHHVLANYLTVLGIYLVSEKIYKQKIRVGYFTDIIKGSFGDVPDNQIRHYMLDTLIGLLIEHYIKKR